MAAARILIIYTGGTIGMGKNVETGILEPLDFNHLVSSMPEFQLIQADIDVRKFDPPIDSSDMDPMRWAELVGLIANNYEEYDGFVILHGTDTMAYTASALSFMLENLTKPVILTGSQLPIGELRTDGKENLMTAIELASMKNKEGRPMVPEVCIFFNGRLLRGNRAIKINAEGFHAFDSFNHPHLCDVGINFTFHDHHILTPDYDKPMVPHLKLDPNVIVFSLFPGIQDAIVRHVLESPTLRGIVMRTYGSGTLDYASTRPGCPSWCQHHQYQSMSYGKCGNEQIRSRLPAKDSPRYQWTRQYRGSSCHQADVPARPIQRQQDST